MKYKLCSPWSFSERVEKRATISISHSSVFSFSHFVSLSNSLLGNELHSSGSLILTPFIMFVFMSPCDFELCHFFSCTQEGFCI